MENLWTFLAVLLIAVVLAACVAMAGVFEGILAAMDDIVEGHHEKKVEEDEWL